MLTTAVPFFFLNSLRPFTVVVNGWRYGLVKADHYRTIEEQNLIQPLLTIPLVSISAVIKTKFIMKKCGFCFMREGDRCYAAPVDREKDGRSKKVIENTQDCDVPDKFVSRGKFYQFLADCVPGENKS